MFVGNRREPNQFEDGRPLRDMNTLRRFIETVRLGDGGHAAFIGNDPSLETIWFESCEPHLIRPWRWQAQRTTARAAHGDLMISNTLDYGTSATEERSRIAIFSRGASLKSAILARWNTDRHARASAENLNL
jgi:hypothetical protein